MLPRHSRRLRAVQAAFCGGSSEAPARDDGRSVTTMGLAHALMKEGVPRLAYDPGEPSPTSWRAEVRAQLEQLMCFPAPLPPQPPPIRLWAAPREGYTLEKWEAYPEPHSVVPFLVLIPDTATEANPAPAVMCFPGSASSKELLAGEPELRPEQPPNNHPIGNQMALQYAQAGFVAVVAENPGIGELDQTPRANRGLVNSGRDKFCAELMALGRN